MALIFSTPLFLFAVPPGGNGLTGIKPETGQTKSRPAAFRLPVTAALFGRVWARKKKRGPKIPVRAFCVKAGAFVSASLHLACQRHLVKLGVSSAPPHKLAVASAFDDAPVVENAYQVVADDGGKPVGNGDGRVLI